MLIPEQQNHIRFNLSQLVLRLEENSKTQIDCHGTNSVTAESTLQKVKHARRLLAELEQDIDTSGSTSSLAIEYRSIHRILDGLYDNAAKQPVSSPSSKTKWLAGVPVPAYPPKIEDIIEKPHVDVVTTPDATQKLEVPPTADLLLSPSETVATPTDSINPSTDNILPSASIATASTTLQNSKNLQEELSLQLAQMATQLRKNAHHFNEALERDQAVLEGLQPKVEANQAFMQREGLRTKSLNKKSWWTTGYTVMAVIVALISFVITVAFIRVTSR